MFQVFWQRFTVSFIVCRRIVMLTFTTALNLFRLPIISLSFRSSLRLTPGITSCGLWTWKDLNLEVHCHKYCPQASVKATAGTFTRSFR